jgi:hypothetical protein
MKQTVFEVVKTAVQDLISSGKFKESLALLEEYKGLTCKTKSTCKKNKALEELFEQVAVISSSSPKYSPKNSPRSRSRSPSKTTSSPKKTENETSASSPLKKESSSSSPAKKDSPKSSPKSSPQASPSKKETSSPSKKEKEAETLENTSPSPMKEEVSQVSEVSSIKKKRRRRKENRTDNVDAPLENSEIILSELPAENVVTVFQTPVLSSSQHPQNDILPLVTPQKHIDPSLPPASPKKKHRKRKEEEGNTSPQCLIVSEKRVKGQELFFTESSQVVWKAPEEAGDPQSGLPSGDIVALTHLPETTQKLVHQLLQVCVTSSRPDYDKVRGKSSQRIFTSEEGGNEYIVAPCMMIQDEKEELSACRFVFSETGKRPKGMSVISAEKLATLF